MKIDLLYCLENNDLCSRVIKTVSDVSDQTNIKAYLVGGFVRDIIMNRPNKDIDIVVVGNALQFSEILAKNLGVKRVVKYEKFGTAMIPLRGMELEIASARNEVYQQTSRNPEISFTNLDEDLKRRDFTINAMAIALTKDDFGTFIDHFHGLQDIKNKIIRTPRDPFETFFDDPLRMLRAIRFASRFNYSIEKETFVAIQKCAERIEMISRERVRDEFMKILEIHKPSEGLRMLDKSGLMNYLFPEIQNLKGIDTVNGYSHKDVYVHTLKVLDNVAQASDDVILRLTALYHDVGKPKTKRFLKGIGWTYHGHEDLGARMFMHFGRKLRLSQKSVKRICRLIKLHLRPIAVAAENVSDSAVRRLMVEVGEDVESLMILCRADITSKNERRIKKYRKNFEFVAQRMKEVDEKDKLRAFQSPVDGMEIMDIFNLKPGPSVGNIKKHVENRILDGHIPNEYNEALDYILKNKEKLIDMYVRNG